MLTAVVPMIVLGNQGSGAFSWQMYEADKLSVTEFRTRRKSLLATMPSGAAVVMTTNPIHQRSNDTDFRFRPESNFWYLTGCEESDSALILVPGGVSIDGKSVSEILFVNDKSPGAETWTGVRMGPEVAKSVLGFEMVLSNQRFAETIGQLRSKKLSFSTRPGGLSGTMAGFWKSMDAAAPAEVRGPGVAATVGKLRGVKSPAEMVLMQKSIAATIAAHVEAIKSAEPGMREYEVQAVVEYIFARNGCEAVAYGSIVGSGSNSCILHYMENRKLMKAGDMVCMDVGGEYHGYASDVTRSYPVSGKFSPEQKAIYELVLEAQEEGIKACVVGGNFGSADKVARKIIGEGLMKLGVTKTAAEGSKYFMHGTSHGVGLDVHDPEQIGTLQPNVVLTVEPGIYIIEGSPCDKRWWNIGVRIEDCIQVTAAGPVNMSGALPRKVADIEKLMSLQGIANLPAGKVIAANWKPGLSGIEQHNCLKEALGVSHHSK